MKYYRITLESSSGKPVRTFLRGSRRCPELIENDLSQALKQGRLLALEHPGFVAVVEDKDPDITRLHRFQVDLKYEYLEVDLKF